jgi:hypothetical protein
MTRPQGLLCGLLRFGALAGGLVACGAQDELFPAGPPMITQVRLAETVTVAGVAKSRTVFGFGSHPLATADDAHPVTTATAAGNRLRVVVDELLAGEALEEVRCRAPVDDDAFARVPAGTTADDVARCAAPDDALAASCPGTGPHDLCVCALDGGCPAGGAVIARGASVGVVDVDQDGAADTARLVAGTASVRCGATDVAIDLAASYWTPAGTQQRPASGGFDALGPALVIVPATLPTGATCGVTFGDRVVDRDGVRLCAPADGDRANGCTPGDTSAIAFTVEPTVFVPTFAPGS